MSEKYSDIAVFSKQKLTEEQAAEIIRRTDQFYCKLYNGNNHEFNRELYKLSGIPARWDEVEKDDSCCDMDVRWMEGKDWSEQYQTWRAWKKTWGCLDLLFLLNDWISCCNISGPNGWISPTGEVGGFFTIGKYPSREEVEGDLKEIAKAFPVLEFTIYMIDEIHEDTIDVEAEWEVSGGAVKRVKEDYSIKDIEFSGIQSDKEAYEKHLYEAPDPENWWTLNELKKLWKPYLAQDIL